MVKEEQWLLEEKYKGENTEGFFTVCQRLAAGEPLGYVIGYVPFLDCKIHLDSKPLTPRPETEFWVEKAITTIKIRRSEAISVLDLCAGSGCVGVAVAKAVPQAKVDFAEIDPCHQPTVIKNLRTNLPGYSTTVEYYRFIESDLFEKIPSDYKYDFILSTPPYIDPAVDRAEESVKNHEPHLALYGGVDGIEMIDNIIKNAKQHLFHNGQVWLEHEPEQTERITILARQHDFVVTTHNDQYGVKRYSVLVLQ